VFDKRFFADMRRSGFGVGVSKARLSQAMVEILGKLPEGTTKLKDTVVQHLGLIGQMSATRDINEAWNDAKKKAANLYPDRFILDERKALHWNDGTVTVLDKKISTPNFKKLNELAERENCSVNQLVSKLLRSYKKTKGA